MAIYPYVISESGYAVTTVVPALSIYDLHGVKWRELLELAKLVAVVENSAILPAHKSLFLF